jgi:hypothetical protein
VQAFGREDVGPDPSTKGIKLAVDEPTQSAKVETSSSTPSRA